MSLELTTRNATLDDLATLLKQQHAAKVDVVAPQVQALAPVLLNGYRSPFTGQTAKDLPVVFAGFVISNSETGGGAFSITPRLVVQVCSNGMQINADAERGVHLGSRLNAGVVNWSAETQRRALKLVTSKARDAVTTFLSPSYLTAKLAELEEKAGKPVTDAAATIATVGKKLAFSEAEQATILDHFVKGGQLTAGGVLQAITSAAQTVENPDTAHDMESRALRALELV